MAKSNYYAEITCRAVGLTKGDFEKELTEIASALFSLDGGAGASVSADVQKMTVTFGFMVATTSKKTAIRQAVSLARTAVHIVGGATPGWPEAKREEQNWPADYEPVAESALTEKELLAA